LFSDFFSEGSPKFWNIDYWACSGLILFRVEAGWGRTYYIWIGAIGSESKLTCLLWSTWSFWICKSLWLTGWISA